VLALERKEISRLEPQEKSTGRDSDERKKKAEKGKGKKEGGQWGRFS